MKLLSLALVLAVPTAASAADEDETPAEVKARLKAMLQFVETLTIWYDQISRLPKTTLIKLMRMGAKVASFVKT